MEELLEEALVPKEEQPYEVPGNWVWVKLISTKDTKDNSFGDGDWILSRNIDPDGEVRLIQLSDIGKGEFLDKSSRYISLETFKELGCTEIFPGDILISRMADPIARSCIIPDIKQKLITAVDIAYLRPNETIVGKEYLNYLFNSTFFRQQAEGIARGTTRLRITRKNLGNLPIPLPPKKEQKQIVVKIERLLNKVNEAKRLIEEAKETFEHRRAAIIKSILQERVINDKVPNGWKKVKVKDIFNIFGGGTPRKSNKDYWNGTIPWISAKDMKAMYITETKDYITEQGLNNSSAKLANKYSVAMVVRSGILQRTLPVAYLLTECTVNQDLKVFDSGDKLINKYFFWYIKGNEKSLLNKYSKSGTTVNSIEFERFKSHEILLPPAEVIEEKIGRLESLIQKEKKVKELVELINQIEVLKSSILSKAFRGELGTNDPAEESAAGLLKEVLEEKI
ncbi:restriction endonuclease subunit S [Siminovitchia fortis]|uniref:Restriction endonuclease subunit S n=2 Tax=Siminovitchia fortis TaxID=254758 RepID=A0A443IWU8_9BACI|nr:restriction endonuclease subunit S [Siminovitchia fortis]